MRFYCLATLSLCLLACQPAMCAEDVGLQSTVPPAAERHRRILVRAAQAELGLNAPIATLAAQVHQESSWRPGATSPAGAQGLAQFMPATSTWIAEVAPQLGTAQPWDPAWSLQAMVVYDHWLHARVAASDPCHRWAMLLSAYNGGLTWVRRDAALALDNGADPLRWFGSVETYNAGRSAANFRENRHYPRAILLRHEPAYRAAGWGAGVCSGARY